MNADKEIWQDGMFRNGSLWEGTVYFYGTDGVLKDVRVYRNGESVKPAVAPVASDTLNRKDSLDRKQGYWIYYGKNRPEAGIPAEGRIEEGSYVNDHKEGKWIKYYDDGVHPKIMGYYANNRPKGLYEKYYISGQLKERGNFDKNRYIDTLTRYNEDGTIAYQAVYDAEGKELPGHYTDTVTVISIGCTFGSEKRSQKAADTLNRSDEKGKQGHWIYYGSDRPGSGIPADGKVEEGDYSDDRKQGIWIRYNPDGTVKNTGEYRDNRPKTNCAIYHGPDTLNRSDEKGKQGHWIYYGKDRPESGIPADGKVEEGDYIDNRKEGTWIKYHIDGKTPKLIGVYKNNRPYGHYDKYNADGSLNDSGNFENVNHHIDSLRRGQWTHDYEQVQVYRNERVPDSLKIQPPQISDKPNMGTYDPKPFYPNGYNKIYNEDDEIWLDGIFKNGQLSDGKVYFYDSDGILLSLSVYRDGKYAGEGQL